MSTASAGVAKDAAADRTVDVSSSSEEQTEGGIRCPPRRFRGYKRGRELGSGASGKVFICSRQQSTPGFAVKAFDLRRMKLSGNEERARTSLAREVEILRSLPPHGNIVQMIDAFQEGDWFLLVLELVGGGDMFSVVTSRQPARLLEREAAFVIRQLCEGLSFLHAHSIIHRDVKLENVLVASQSQDRGLALYGVKITDFGLSKNVGGDESAAISCVGTRPYIAPEIVGQGAYDFTSDVWSLGIVLFVLLAGHYPFQQSPQEQGHVELIISKRGLGGEHAKAIMSGLLQIEPKCRLHLTSLCNHEWLQFWKNSEQSDGQPKRKRLHVAGVSSSHAMVEACASVVGLTSAPPVMPTIAGPRSFIDSRCDNSLSTTSSFDALFARMSAQGRGGDFDRLLPKCIDPDLVHVFLGIPDRRAGFLLGKAGVHVKHISMVVGCQVVVSQASGADLRLVSITGNFNQTVLVQEVLLGRLKDEDSNDFGDGFEAAFLIRVEALGVVVGKNNFVLDRIQRRTGARIRVLREHVVGYGICIIAGTTQKILHAEKHIFHLARRVPLVAAFGGEMDLPPWSPPVFSPYAATPLPSPLTSP